MSSPARPGGDDRQRPRRRRPRRGRPPTPSPRSRSSRWRMLACLDRGSRTLSPSRPPTLWRLRPPRRPSVARNSRPRRRGGDVAGVAGREPDGAPAIDDALVYLACDLRDVLAAGDHVIVTGESPRWRPAERPRSSSTAARQADTAPAWPAHGPTRVASSADGGAAAIQGTGLVHEERLQPHWSPFSARRGLSLAGSRVLEVQGRKSGEWRQTPVNPLKLGDERYLVAPRGAHPVGAEHPGQRQRKLVGRGTEEFSVDRGRRRREAGDPPRLPRKVEVGGRRLLRRRRPRLHRRGAAPHRPRPPGLPHR